MMLSRQAKWRRANPDRNRATKDAWGTRNPEKMRELRRRYRERNRERIRIAARARRKRDYDTKYPIVRALLDALKSVPCMDCGGMFDPICMDFDHRPGETKLFNVSAIRTRRTLDVVRAEIAKCDVVCSNCHRLRSKRRGTYTRKG